MAPSLFAARLRHAHHFVEVASRAEMLYQRGGEGQAEGLALFDAERPQIDAAWSWARSQPPSEDIDAVLNSFAYATVEIGDLRYSKRLERIPQLEAALEAAHRWDATELIAAWLGNLGLAHHYLGELHVAAAYHAQHLNLANEMGDQIGAVNALTNIGLTYFALADYPTARQAYETALAITRQVADRKGEATLLGHLGSLYLAHDEPGRAEECLKQGIAAAQELGDRRLEAASLGNLGNLRYQRGEAAAALELYRRQLTIVRDLGNRRAEAIAHSNLGNVALALGDAAAAEGSYRAALELADQLGEERVAALVAWNLGLRLEKRGELAAAAPLLQRTVDYERSIGHPDAQPDAAYLQRLVDRLAAGSLSSAPSPAPEGPGRVR